MNKDFTQFNYAAKTEELEGVLAHLQSEDIEIDEALKLHAVGKKLVTEIEDYLRHAENEVKKQLTKA